MSLHILDTDMLSLLQEGHPRICERAKDQPQQDLAISVISVEEQLSGWYTLLRRSKKSNLAWAYRRLSENVRFLSHLQIIGFDEAAIERYERLLKLKLNVRKMDLRIAAIVVESDATLVTRNVRDFKRIPGHAYIDWTK